MAGVGHVATFDRGGGRVWGDVAEGGYAAVVGICGRWLGLWQGWGHIAGVRECGRGWGHMASVVAGCGGMWQGLGIYGKRSDS